jgi:transcriptional regulator with XRE-family HTH domain
MGIARQSPPSSELMVFSDRLQKVIEFKKIDISDLAKNAEYKPDDIRKLLAGMREPSMKKLMLLADSLGCSADYLLGLTPEPQRASIVVESDTDAIKPQSSERGQTSGQISGNVEQFLAIIPELMDSDIELLMYIAGFLIERKEKRVTRIVDAVTAKSSKEAEALLRTSYIKNNDELDDDDFEEDEDDGLWDGVEDDEFEDDDLEEDDFDEDDDFEDEYEDEDEDDFDDD